MNSKIYTNNTDFNNLMDSNNISIVLTNNYEILLNNQLACGFTISDLMISNPHCPLNRSQIIDDIDNSMINPDMIINLIDTSITFKNKLLIGSSNKTPKYLIRLKMIYLILAKIV